MEIINLTPHAIRIDFGTLESPAERSILPSGIVARCSSVSAPAGSHDGVPLARTVYGEVVGLPEAVEGVLYVVSALVRSAAPHRVDVASPGDLVRDLAGQIIGCRNLTIS